MKILPTSEWSKLDILFTLRILRNTLSSQTSPIAASRTDERALRKSLLRLCASIPKKLDANFHLLSEDDKKEVATAAKATLPYFDFQHSSEKIFDLMNAIHHYANYNQWKPRNRMDPKEKEFVKLLPKLDLSQDQSLIQDKLSTLGLKVEETALRKYLKKYTSR